MTKPDYELFKLKAQLCKTFADAKRLIILDQLCKGEKSVGDLAQSLGVNQSLVSRHLAVLRDRGVVQSRRCGTTIYYSLSDLKIGQACEMVHEILIGQIEKNRKFTERLIR